MLVCPQTGGTLTWMESSQELWCALSRLAYPVKDGIPVMIVEQARQLTDQEYEQIKK